MNITKEFRESKEFYRALLQLLSSFLEKKKQLTETELDIMVYILLNPGPLEGHLRKNLMRLLSLSSQSLSAHLKRIKNKGWVDGYGMPDKYLTFVQDRVIKGSFNVAVNFKYEHNQEGV